MKRNVSIVGYGVFATEDVKAGAFLLEYVVQLMTQEEAAKLPDQTYVFDFAVGTLSYR